MASIPTPNRALLDRTYPRAAESLPPLETTGGAYALRFARTPEDLIAVQRLRFEIFNLELSEGLEASYRTGLDQDLYDAGCHHLMVIDRKSADVVGTYRVQTLPMARAFHGLYTAGEFDLGALPAEVLEASVETGRACVAAEHRNGRVLTLLWKGLAAYLVWNRKRYMFGCCSLTSQDPHVAKQTYDVLLKGSFVHPTLRTDPLPAFVCYGPDFEADPNVAVKLPPLFAGYLKLGAKVTGAPAIDREFKTIDFLTILDAEELEDSTRRTFFGPAAGA